VASPILVPFGGGEVVGDSADRRVEILSEHETRHARSRFGPHRGSQTSRRSPSCGFGEGDTVPA
jgi:hypothetical protein